MEFIAPADHDETADVVRRLAVGKTVTGFVDRIRTRAGETRTVMWIAVPDPGRGVFHIIGRALTEQRRTEEALRQSKTMEAVGQLTGGIAHDLDDLLAGITGALEPIERRIAQGSAKRAAGLTHRLLAFSRRQTLALGRQT